MQDENANGLIVQLTHELGVSLEMSYDAEELNEIWPDAVDGLKEADQMLTAAGLSTPQPALNVIALAESHRKEKECNRTLSAQ